MDRHETESTASLVGDAFGNVTKLVRYEIDLARAEMDENLRRAGVAIGLIIAALVILQTSLNVLAAAVATALANLGLEPGWAVLIVGAVLALLAWGLLAKGLRDLKFSSLAPTRTAENIKRDAQAVKGI